MNNFSAIFKLFYAIEFFAVETLLQNLAKKAPHRKIWLYGIYQMWMVCGNV